MGKHSIELTEDQIATEEWRPIPDFPDYAVSEYGRVRRIKESLSRNSRYGIGYILSPGCANGYRFFNLMKNGTPNNIIQAHRLVALAFLGECPDGLQVNHKDGDKFNNHWSNLEYVTSAENIHHAAGVLNVGPFKLSRKQATEIRMRYHDLGWKTDRIAKHYDVSLSNIRLILRGILYTGIDDYPPADFDGAIGEKNIHSKLTPHIVRDCRRRYSSGQNTMPELCEEYGVHISNMSRAIRGITWKHVTD